jgi:hypothetical protein
VVERLGRPARPAKAATGGPVVQRGTHRWPARGPSPSSAKRTSRCSPNPPQRSRTPTAIPGHRRGHRRRVGTAGRLESPPLGGTRHRARGAGVPRWAVASVEHVLAAPGSACHACGVPVPRPQGSCGPPRPGWGELVCSVDAEVSRKVDVKGNIAVLVTACSAVPQSKGCLKEASAKSKEASRVDRLCGGLEGGVRRGENGTEGAGGPWGIRPPAQPRQSRL